MGAKMQGMASAEAGAAVTTRRFELDGLRGIAVVLVVADHVLGGVTPSERGLLPGWVQHGGLVGVQLFFVLSGYLITRNLLRGVGLGDFYRRRVRRLYPSLLVVSAVVLVWSGDAASTVRALTYTENLHIGDHGAATMSHSWSLAVEEQFYLVWPLLLLAFRRHAAAVAVAGIALTWWAQAFSGWSDHAVYVGLRWDAVLAGCVLALVAWRGNRWTFTAGACVAAVAAVGADVSYPVLTVACVLVVGSVPQFRAGWLEWLGRISYPLYLWHVAVLRLDIPAPIGLALSIALAEITYRLIDRRAQLLTPVRLTAGRAPRLIRERQTQTSADHLERHDLIETGGDDPLLVAQATDHR